MSQEKFVDALGIPFDEYREHLQKNAGDFPKMQGNFKQWTELAGWYHENYPFCFVCGMDPKRAVLECHHIEGGPSRTHEACNAMVLCLKHHDQVNTNQLPKGHLLWRKWIVDQPNTDWVRMAIIRRRFLPDLVIHEEVQHAFEKCLGRNYPWPAFECPIIRARE